MTTSISLPDPIAFAGFYYPEVLRELLLFLRRNKEELGLTDENDFELHVQLVRAFALVAHLNNTRLDTVANELLIDTATMLESFKRLLRLIGIELASATPAQVDVLLQLANSTTSDITGFIPELAEFDTQSTPPIPFEDLVGLDLDRTDQVSYAYGLQTEKAGAGGYVDTVSPDIFWLSQLDEIIALANELKADYNAHRILTTGGVHGAADTTNVVSSADATDLASLITLLNEIKADYNAHRVLIAGSVHGLADTTNVVASADATDLASATTLANEIRTDYEAHRILTTGGVHGAADTTNIVSAYAYVGFASGDVNKHLFIPKGLADNGGEFRIIEYISAISVRVIRVPGSGSPGYQSETNLSWKLKAFSADGATSLNSSGPTFSPWAAAPVVEDLIFIGHAQALFGQVDIIHSSFGANFSGVFEYFDNTDSAFAPTSVTDNGDGTITFNVNSLLGTLDRRGASVIVENLITGNKEHILTTFSTNNLATTQTTLGQSTISTDVDEYRITADWVPLENQTDNTADFTADGVITFNFPQTIDRNWQPTEVNLIEAYWLRYRVIVVTSPTAPVLDEVDIDSGAQYLVRTCTQGETVGPQIAGSSNGAASQEFTLADSPFLDGSETIEVDETGGGSWTTYAKSENFLSSTATSRHYTLQVDSDDQAKVIFGDGVSGKIPPSGTDNIRATYRIGGDTSGNVGAGEVSVNSDGLSGIASVSNPRAAYGWRIKDGGTVADRNRLRRDKPAELRTRDKAVEETDIERLAVNSYTNVAGIKPVVRAVAVGEALGPKTVKLLVVGDGGTTLTAAEKESLEEYFNGDRYSSPPVEGHLVLNHAVTVFNYEPKLVTVNATVVWPGGSAAAIRSALLTLLHPLTVEADGVTYVWDFGGFVSLSRIYAEIHAVDPNIVNVSSLLLNGVAGSVSLGANELPITTASSLSFSVTES